MMRKIANKLNPIGRAADLSRLVLGDSFPAFVESVHQRASKSYQGIVFDTSSALAQWRAKTHLTKEPNTIHWIDSFEVGNVFFDVGANVGVYSLYGARHKDIKVYSFEPSPFNFSTLCRNIALNGLSDKVSAFCLALSDKTVLDYLHISSLQVGAAHTGFQNPVNEFGKPLNVAHKQATLGFRMDDFIKLFNLPVPQHIKIDVDGAEALVVSGMGETLKNPALKSILIELPARAGGLVPEVLRPILESGFEITQEDHPDGDVRLSNYILRRVR